MRPVQPDDKLSAIVSRVAAATSSGAYQKALELHKKHGVKDKKKRTMINADDSLRPVFNGKSQVSMFEMTIRLEASAVDAALIQIGKDCQFC